MENQLASDEKELILIIGTFAAILCDLKRKFNNECSNNHRFTEHYDKALRAVINLGTDNVLKDSFNLTCCAR